MTLHHPFRPLRISLFHGTAHRIRTLETSYGGLLEDAPPAAYLTPDPATARAYARRTARILVEENGQRLQPRVYRVLLHEPLALDLTNAVDYDGTFLPAYRASRDHGDHGPWTRCLARLADLLNQAEAQGCGAASILTPAGPDGQPARTPEYLTFRPAQNTRITACTRLPAR